MSRVETENGSISRVSVVRDLWRIAFEAVSKQVIALVFFLLYITRTFGVSHESSAFLSVFSHHYCMHHFVFELIALHRSACWQSW